MENLEHLLNALLQKGWKPFGLEHITNIVHENKKIVCRQNGKHWFNYSLRELASLESGLWQFATKMRMHRENLYEDYKDELLDYEENIVNFSWEQKIRDDHGFTIQTVNKARLSSYQYRLIESALVPEEELAQFLLDTIILQGNSK